MLPTGRRNRRYSQRLQAADAKLPVLVSPYEPQEEGLPHSTAYASQRLQDTGGLRPRWRLSFTLVFIC